MQAIGGLLLTAGAAATALADAPGSATAEAPRAVFQRSGGSPSRGLRPIGAPPSTHVRQTAFMQQGDFGVPTELGASPPAGGASPFAAPPLVGDDYGGSTTPPSLTAPPVTAAPPTPSPGTTAPPATTAPLEGLQPVAPLAGPLAAPPQPRYQPSGPSASPSDLAPLPQPQLPSNWATVDNCNLVSGPSGYRAEFGFCGTTPVMPIGVPAYAAPPVVVPPTALPAAPVVPMAAAPFGCRPLFTLGQENYNVQLGQGIIGQPTAYVPGQNIRNFIRYLSP